MRSEGACGGGGKIIVFDIDMLTEEVSWFYVVLCCEFIGSKYELEVSSCPVAGLGLVAVALKRLARSAKAAKSKRASERN